MPDIIWLIADCSRGLVLGLWTSSGGEELLETVAHARSFLFDGRRARPDMQHHESVRAPVNSSITGQWQ